METEANPPHEDLNDRGPTGASARFERQKQRILDAATLLLNQKGVWGMTLQEVARALDLTTSSVTYYFKRREDLAAGVFEDSLARLASLARQAARAPTPRHRVARYIELYFEQSAEALRGQARPFASLAEIRALNETTRSTLIGQYQEIFRAVRGFFGVAETADRKLILTARAHILNEALFWSDIWLPRYAIGDFSNVGRRLLSVLDGGLATPGTPWTAQPLTLDRAPDVAEQQAFLRVATQLINESGYKGASVDRIARQLNRNKTAFYRHIEGKDNLVAECSRASYHRLAELQNLANRRHSSPWHRITTTLSSALALQFQDEFPLLRSSALQAMPLALRGVALEQANRTALGLMGVLVEGMQEGTVRISDPWIASQVILSAINASYDLKGWRRSQPVEKAIAIYSGVLASGLFDSA